MNIPSEFDDIRPYKPEEISAAVDQLAQDPLFCEVMKKAMPGIPLEVLIAKAKQCRNLLEFQKTFDYSWLKSLLAEHSDGIDMQADELDRSTPYTFVSNHRDIVLDAAFLSEMMVDLGFDNTVEMCVGDNLMQLPWIRTLIRLNKGIVVKRGISMREQLLASRELSSYLHFAIKQKKESIWIAQRQGRAKDSSDLTQESIIKMFCMGGEGTLKERLSELNIVPLTISYEFDPCDCLKAREFQLKRDNPDYRKNREDDINSMSTGIFGYKGRIHYQAATTLNHWLSNLPDDLPKGDFCNIVAARLDHVIHSNYRLFANNYIASDKLRQEERFKSLYTAEEKLRFEEYLVKQIHRIDLPHPDFEFLEKKILEMYANPLYNYLKAAEQKEHDY